MRWFIAFLISLVLGYLVFQNYQARSALVALETRMIAVEKESQRLQHVVKAYEQRFGAINLPGFTADGEPARPTPRPTRRFQRAPGL